MREDILIVDLHESRFSNAFSSHSPVFKYREEKERRDSALDALWPPVRSSKNHITHFNVDLQQHSNTGTRR